MPTVHSVNKLQPCNCTLFADITYTIISLHLNSSLTANLTSAATKAHKDLSQHWNFECQVLVLTMYVVTLYDLCAPEHI